MICKDCGKEFNMAPGEVKFYEANHLKLPKRCPDCRATRKTANEAAERQRKWKEAEKRLCLLLDNFPFSQTNNLEFNKPDQSLVVIGNGFDIMHGVKSSYWDFQKTIGKKSSLRYDMETYLDVPSDSLWYNLEDSLGRLNHSMFLRSTGGRFLCTSAKLDDYSDAAEPPVRCGVSHHSGLTEPPVYCY